ncbi:hypothetical protein, partial [Achromobacter xylosoxidans]|uniref:hypothetical protein n=1 Tax=Alcaligenes xylosoxydans xylosoxydans TaxID=85698 RepID=UPI001F12EB7F
HAQGRALDLAQLFCGIEKEMGQTARHGSGWRSRQNRPDGTAALPVNRSRQDTSATAIVMRESTLRTLLVPGWVNIAVMRVMMYAPTIRPIAGIIEEPPLEESCGPAGCAALGNAMQQKRRLCGRLIERVKCITQ